MIQLLVSLLLLAVCCSAATSRPNIVFIFSDDHAYQAISAYQHPLKLIETPQIDRLAKEGIIFNRCLVPNSICGPSRACVLTGKYNHINGFFNNEGGNIFDGSQTTFPKLLQASGYTTALIGKWHLVSDPTGFDFWEILTGQGIYYNPNMIRMGERVKVPGYVTDVITEHAVDWLKQRDISKPFLLMMQHKAPHREWSPALRHLDHDHDRKYPEPPTLFDNYAGRGSAEHNQDMTISKTMTELDMKLKTPPSLNAQQRKEWNTYYEPRNETFRAAGLEGDELTRWKYNRYLHDYLGCVKAVDESVGTLLKYLDDEKLAANTIVVYASDQGFFLGEHGWFDKRWIFEESLRTPCLVRWPSTVKAGSVNSNLVSVIDFAETLLDVAGLPVPSDMQGRSLMPIFRGETPADWRKSFYYHYYEFPGSHSVRKHYGVVTDRYKLVHFYESGVDYWEMFDLEKDAQEMRSVFGQADYAKVQKDLEAELARLRKELKVPETDPPASIINKPLPSPAPKDNVP